MPAEPAYDIEGTGTPVVFLHGLTFDRRMWRPITVRLNGPVMTIAIDLPAHGQSGAEPAPLEKFADQLHELLTSLARSGRSWSATGSPPGSSASAFSTERALLRPLRRAGDDTW